MQIVIDIPDEWKTRIECNRRPNTIECMELVESIWKGKMLPKGHGRLIDIGRLDKDMLESDNPIIYLTLNGEYIEGVSLDYLNGLPMIIEADKEVKDEY